MMIVLTKPDDNSMILVVLILFVAQRQTCSLVTLHMDAGSSSLLSSLAFIETIY